MAVKRIVTPNKFVGLSTDTKPTQATTPRARDGDTFYEYDTGMWYITYDGTNWVEKTDAVSAPSSTVSSEPMFGKPVLFSGANGKASWENGWHYGASSRAASGWAARLIPGKQTSWNDFAQVKVDVNNMRVPDFTSASWTYWMENAEAFGLNIVWHLHDPADFDKEIEITQEPSWSTLDKAAGFNSHELSLTADHLYYYGTTISGLTGNNASSLYGWEDYAANATLLTWVIDSISISYGWHTSDFVFDDALLLQLEINGINIPLKPSLEQMALSKHYVDNDIPISSGIYTPRRIHVKPVFSNYGAIDGQGIGNLVRCANNGIDNQVGYAVMLGSTTAGADVNTCVFPVNIPLNKIETMSYLEKMSAATSGDNLQVVYLRLDANRSGAYEPHNNTDGDMYLGASQVGLAGATTWTQRNPFAQEKYQLVRWHTPLATPDNGVTATNFSTAFSAYQATDIGDYIVKEIGWAYTGSAVGKYGMVACIVINGVEYIFDLDPHDAVRHFYCEHANDVIAKTLYPMTPFRLLSIDIHLSAALATGELITITKDSGFGTNDYHDTVIFSEDLYVGTRLSYHGVFGEGYEFGAADELDIALSANSLNRNVGIDVAYEIL